MSTHKHSGGRASRGMALLMVMVALTVCVLVGTVFLAAAGTASAMGRHAEDRLRARMIAETGLAMAINYTQSEANWRNLRSNGLWVSEQSLSGGAFSVWGEDGQVNANGVVVGDGSLSDSAAHAYTLTCVGSYGSARHRVRVTITPRSEVAVAVTERIEMRNTTAIDSYSSALGPYGGANKGEAASISSNSIGKPNVTLQNRAKVNGNLYVGAGGDASRAILVKDSAVITGSTGALPAEVAMPDITPPDLGASVGDVKYDKVCYLMGDLHVKNLTLQATAIRVIGPVRFVADGDCAVTGSAQVLLNYRPSYALAVTTSAEVLDQASVDSYDSSVGDYGGDNLFSAAVIGTSSVTSSDVRVGGTVKGSVYVGVGGDPATVIRVDPGGTVTGNKAAHAAVLSIPAPPSWPAGLPASIGNYAKSGGTNTISADMQVDSFRLTNGAKVTISGNRILRVNNEFSVEDNSKIELASNSSLTVYVAQYIKVAGTGLVNANTKDPYRVIFYALGNGFEHTLANTAQVHAIIDSPRSRLQITDDAQLFGRFMGSAATLKTRGKLHHDLNTAIEAVDSRLPTLALDNRLTVYTGAKLTFETSAQVNMDTTDCTRVVFNHNSLEMVEAKGHSVTRATLVAPDALVKVRETATWHGRLRGCDLQVEGDGIVNADASGGAAAPAVISEETILLKDDAVINAVGGSLALASSSAGTVVILLKDSSKLSGDAYGGPGGNGNAEVKVGSSAVITGRILNLTEAIPIELPPTPVLPGTASSLTVKGSTQRTVSGDIYCDKLEVGGDGVLTIDGPTRLVCKGDVILNGRGVLQMTEGATLSIYCYKNLDIQDDVKINLNGMPSRLNIYYAGTSTVEIKNRSMFCGTLVAPNVEIKVKDDGQLFGFSRSLRLKTEARGKIHCDAVSKGSMRWIE